jgi:multiple sugar transport system substrate-binding protein
MAQTRRTVLKAGATVAAFGAFGAPGFAQSETRLRMFWWGSRERAERTDKTNRLYQDKNPGVTITGETLGWADYWPRLATQTAGRNAPDVIQMDYRYIYEYARRGALLPLDPFVGKGLDLTDFSAAAIDSGKVDRKIYGVSLGLNSTAMMFDQGLIGSLGLKTPTHDMTWAQVGELALEITKAAKRPGFYGLFDGGRYEPALEVWLRQRGKALYTDDGKLGFDVSDIGEWLGFWHDLRKRGAIASAEVAALDMGELDTSLLTVGKTAMVLAHSNQLVGFQALVKSKLGMTMYPSGGPGAKVRAIPETLDAAQRLRAHAHPEAAVKLVDFYVANREAGMILGVERGVPASASVRKAVEPTLDELGNAMASYVAFVSDKVSDLPVPPPQGAGEIQTVLRRVNEQIGFGRLSVADGAKQFIAEANAVLARG